MGDFLGLIIDGVLITAFVGMSIYAFYLNIKIRDMNIKHNDYKEKQVEIKDKLIYFINYLLHIRG